MSKIKTLAIFLTFTLLLTFVGCKKAAEDDKFNYTVNDENQIVDAETGEVIEDKNLKVDEGGNIVDTTTGDVVVTKSETLENKEKTVSNNKNSNNTQSKKTESTANTNSKTTSTTSSNISNKNTSSTSSKNTSSKVTSSTTSRTSSTTSTTSTGDTSSKAKSFYDALRETAIPKCYVCGAPMPDYSRDNHICPNCGKDQYDSYTGNCPVCGRENGVTEGKCYNWKMADMPDGYAKWYCQYEGFVKILIN